MLETVGVTRYVTPLREGGSLPGIVEADDLGTYVCKFRGAGQGTRVLVAEVIASGLAQRVGLSTPRLVVLDLDPAIARYEADEEVQDLLNASPGPNLGVDFLPGAFGYDGELAGGADGVGARILWLDAFTANVDRSWRNPNLLRWHDGVWVIDHGASLYFHHAWGNGPTAPERFAAQPWDVSDHVLRRPRPPAARGRRRGRRPPGPRRLRRGAGRRAGRLARAGARGRDPRRSCGRPTSPSSTRAWPPGSGFRWSAPRETVGPALPVRRAAVRAEGWTVRSSSTSAWCSTARRPTSSTRRGTSTAERLVALDPRIDVDQVCEALTFVDGVCAGDDRGGEAARQPIGTRFGFLKAPRSTVAPARPGPRRRDRRPGAPAGASAGETGRVKVFLSDGRVAALLERRHRRPGRAGLPRLSRHPPDRDDGGQGGLRRRRPPARLQPSWLRFVDAGGLDAHLRRDATRPSCSTSGASSEVAVLGMSVGGSYAAAFAATYPERVTALGAGVCPGQHGDRHRGHGRGRRRADASGVHGVAREDRPGRRGRRGARGAVPGRAAGRRRCLAPRVRRRVRRLSGLRGAGEAGGLPPRRRAAVPAVGLRGGRRALPGLRCGSATATTRRSRLRPGGSSGCRRPTYMSLPDTSHLAALLTQWPVILRRLRAGAQQRRVDHGRRLADLRRLLERAPEGQQQRLAARRTQRTSARQAPGLLGGSRPARPGSGTRPALRVPQPCRPGYDDRRPRRPRRSVASMPCSPATARSRARCTSYAARSASWSTASAFSTWAWPNFRACVGVRLVPRGQLAHRADRCALGQRGQVGVDVARELVVQHRQLVGLRQRRHLDERRHRGRAARCSAARNTSASSACRSSGSGGTARRTPRRVSGPDPSPYVSAGQHAEQGGRVGDGAAHRAGAVLAGRDRAGCRCRAPGPGSA